MTFKSLISKNITVIVVCLKIRAREEDIRPHRGPFPPQVKKIDSLQELLSLSDVISLHCPLTNETVQIINAETIKFIKPGKALL